VRKLVTETAHRPVPAGLQVVSEAASNIVIVRVTICRPIAFWQRANVLWARLRGRKTHQTHHEVVDFHLPAKVAMDFAISVYKAAGVAHAPSPAPGTRPS
jgi:hypothetical protein